jgi:hypothetical protein
MKPFSQKEENRSEAIFSTGFAKIGNTKAFDATPLISVSSTVALPSSPNTKEQTD